MAPLFDLEKNWSVIGTPDVPFHRHLFVGHIQPAADAVVLLAGETLMTPVIPIPENVSLHIAFGPALPDLSDDGLDFDLHFEFEGHDGKPVKICSQAVCPGKSVHWNTMVLDLACLAGKRGRFLLSCGPGPQGDSRADWLAIRAFTIVEGRKPDPVSLLQAEAEGRLIQTDYPYRPSIRPSETRVSWLRDRLAAESDRYASFLSAAQAMTNEFLRIPVRESAPTEPHWVNGWLPALDAISLYTMIATTKPQIYLEVGSGNSTKFARRAIVDHGLSTRIISIDPAPRAEIDGLCDEVIRKPLECVDRGIFAQLQNDVIFIDNSHRSFQNSDVTVFFTEIINEIPGGCIYGIHDIFSPFDYGEPILPPEWPEDRLPEPRKAIEARFSEFIQRFYNEQYLLEAYLAGGAAGDDVVFPCAWVTSRVELLSMLEALWKHPALAGLEPWGGAFWLRRQSGRHTPKGT